MGGALHGPVGSPGSGDLDTAYGRHFTLDRPGCQVHCWLAGQDGAPLVTLSHAALVDHTLFVHQLPALTERYRVLTWDIRGHGRSRPLTGPFSVPDAAADLAAVLDELRAERAVMLGHSMGSYVGQEMTFRHPGRVSALTVIDGTCITADPGRVGRAELRMAGPMMRAWPYGSLKKASVEQSAENEDTRAYLRRQFDALTKAEYLKIMDGVDRCVHPEPSYRLPVPALLILGEKDRTGDIATTMPAWAAREPQAEYAVIAGAGHCSNYDQPERTNDVILPFLRRNLPG